MPITSLVTVLGPVTTDRANGPVGMNTICDQIEKNLDRVNAWAGPMDTSLASNRAVTDTALITPAAGWELMDPMGNLTYGRKWGALTYVHAWIKRTGGAIAASPSGNVTNSTMCTLAVGYRPLRAIAIQCVMSSFAPVGVYIDTGGVCVLEHLNQANQTMNNGWHIIVQAMFPNSN